MLPFGAALWGMRHKRSIIYHIHEVSLSPTLLRIILIWFIERTACCVIYVSNDQRNRLPIRVPKTFVVHNPINPEVAQLGFKTEYSPMRSGFFEVLMLASPREFKGVPEFIELSRRFLAYEEVRFTLVLNCSEDELERVLGKYGSSENLQVHSQTSKPAKFYMTADVVLNLSRVDMWIETFGMTIVEAMAFGIPVIAPPEGGPTEIISDNETGFLVDSRDDVALDQTLINLLRNPHFARKVSCAARVRAEDFSQIAFNTSLHDVFDGLTRTAINEEV
jgi:glycosyltransferase involved in cell wall biosynthesis